MKHDEQREQVQDSSQPHGFEFSDADIVRKDARSASYCPNEKEGEICRMTQQDAAQYCKEQGGHLPSTREFAAFAKDNGILEAADLEMRLAGAVPDGYYLVASEGENGTIDSFYFNNEGVRRLTGELAQNSFWTSSIVLDKPDYVHVFYGAVCGGGGPAEEHHRSYKHAVLLIPD